MKLHRRSFLAAATSAVAAAATSAFWPLRALAQLVRPQEAFAAKTLDEALSKLGGTPQISNDIALHSPAIAENGAVVPVTVSSRIPGTQQIAILVEVNPNPLAALFSFPEGTEPSVNTRVKFSRTGRLYAVVKAQDKLYMISRETKVTLGGCGG